MANFIQLQKFNIFCDPSFVWVLTDSKLFTILSGLEIINDYPGKNILKLNFMTMDLILQKH